MENKKRAMREGDEEDEMKMEKFYSLLRSFRDARDRRRRELEMEKDESMKKKMKTTTTTTTTTKEKAEVSFEFQDFTSEIHFRKPPLVFPNPIPCDRTTKDIKSNKNKEQQQQKDLALDLKLAL